MSNYTMLDIKEQIETLSPEIEEREVARCSAWALKEPLAFLERSPSLCRGFLLFRGTPVSIPFPFSQPTCPLGSAKRPPLLGIFMASTSLPVQASYPTVLTLSANCSAICPSHQWHKASTEGTVPYPRYLVMISTQKYSLTK